MIHPDQRAAVLRDLRRRKMARSAHAYVRGSTARFYEWLAEGDHGTPEGPPVWICGDCHLGNLGPLADAQGGIAVQIRDLDQTVIGNPAHDLIRLGLSLASEARGARLSGVVSVRLLGALARGYSEGLSEEPGATTVWRPKSVRLRLKKSAGRRWSHLAAERLAEAAARALPIGRKFWPLRPQEGEALTAFFDSPAIHRLVTALEGRDPRASVRVVDAAYWRKGCSSLGRLRYAVLLEVGEGVDLSLSLLDVKESTAAAAPHASAAAMPEDDGERVVAGAVALSPNLGRRMHAGRLLDRSVVVRELMPQDLKLKFAKFTEKEATELAAYLGRVVGRSHARQMDDSTRATWRAALECRRPSASEAPDWLWTSVVELLALHEAAYLEHCRLVARASPD